MADAPVARLAPDAQWHPDTDSAALEVLQKLDASAGDETAGVLYGNKQGQHSYSAPVSNKEREGFNLRATVQDGQRITGIYHNHPGTDSNAQYFSPDDISVANKLGVPSYILFADGSVRKYVPGKTSTTNLNDGSSHYSQRVARGDPVNPPPQTQQTQTTQSLPAVPVQLTN